MNCLESRELLHTQLDGDNFDRSALEGHLASCPECTSLHAAAGRLLEGLRLLPPVLAPEGMGEQMVALVLADHRAHSRRRWAVRITAAAAALLVAALGAYYWPRPVENTPIPPGPLVEQPLQPATPSLRDSADEAKSAVVNLTLRKADETVAQTRRLWPAVTPPSLGPPDALTDPLEPPVRSLREAGQHVSAGLEPVTNSARRAFGMFLRELPPMGGEDKPGF